MMNNNKCVPREESFVSIKFSVDLFLFECHLTSAVLANRISFTNLSFFFLCLPFLIKLIACEANALRLII